MANRLRQSVSLLLRQVLLVHVVVVERRLLLMQVLVERSGIGTGHCLKIGMQLTHIVLLLAVASVVVVLLLLVVVPPVVVIP
jgi:hypothetical protein